MINTKNKRRAIQISLIISFGLVIADYIYMTIENISYLEKEKCVINQFLPRIWFLFFEYFVELGIVVFLGVFAATLLEKYFLKYKRFFPSNTVTAFLYGSVLPVCACTAIPIVRTMQEKMNMRTLVTFIVAAPLLNPYIIMLSFSVLGVPYGIFRIISSFALAVSSGYVVEYFHSSEILNTSEYKVCKSDSCSVFIDDIYLKTFHIFKSVAPYLIAGGLLSVGIELFVPKSSALSSMINNSFLGNVLLILTGIPLYFCNGTDVLLLRPLVCSGIYTGTAIAFSLTSTAICITSMFMLFKFMGKKLTIILTVYIFGAVLTLSQIINFFYKG